MNGINAISTLTKELRIEDVTSNKSDVLNLSEANKVTQTTPFQIILDEATDALQSVSKAEFENNNLIDRYIKKEATIEEVMISTAKFNLAINACVSILTQTVQSVKELQGVPL